MVVRDENEERVKEVWLYTVVKFARTCVIKFLFAV